MMFAFSLRRHAFHGTAVFGGECGLIMNPPDFREEAKKQKGGGGMPIRSEYTLTDARIPKALRLLIIGDVHNEPYDALLPLLSGADALLVPGDIANRYNGRWEIGIRFLEQAARRLPVFFSPGNHETRLAENYETILRQAAEAGARVLCCERVDFEGIVIGGCSFSDPEEPVCLPRSLTDGERYQIMLCHKPEWAARLLDTPIDLWVSGHAHGGQIAVFGHGVLAPGQGLFPKYTRGLYHGKLLVTAGVGNPCRMPRWGNPREAALLTLLPGGHVPEVSRETV